MRLILIGPPGCGKGTQAKLLASRQNLEHIATGDLLREAIRQNNPLGVRARKYVESGQLVPDELVNDLIGERFQRADRPPRFVMDGYPRTLTQAETFDQILGRYSLGMRAVLLLKVDDEEIVKRLSGRWTCPKTDCKATYHTQTHPPKAPGICDDCGTKLVQREDDRPETVRARLVVYHKETVELIPYYRERGLLREVCGSGEIEQVYANLMQALN